MDESDEEDGDLSLSSCDDVAAAVRSSPDKVASSQDPLQSNDCEPPRCERESSPVVSGRTAVPGLQDCTDGAESAEPAENSGATGRCAGLLRPDRVSHSRASFLSVVSRSPPPRDLSDELRS